MATPHGKVPMSSEEVSLSPMEDIAQNCCLNRERPGIVIVKGQVAPFDYLGLLVLTAAMVTPRVAANLATGGS